MLVLLCRVLLPISALPCRDTLQAMEPAADFKSSAAPARMLFTALQLVASVPRGGRLLFCFILFCHWYSPVDYRCNYPRASQIRQTNLVRTLSARRAPENQSHFERFAA
jgi:hypothetical protein